MNARLKPKHQRLVLVVVALVAIVVAGIVAAWALRNQASYFYLPEQMAANPPEVGQAVRLGGMVEEGSLQRLPDGVTVAFMVTGNEDARVPVRYAGLLPDLFVEGSGVVAEGRLGPDGTFVADNLLAKHDENYVPRELMEMDAHRAARMAEETTVGLE
jgi:cytochrome c-type biogenesis protein CcmE